MSTLDDIALIRDRYGDFAGLYDAGQAVAHVRMLLAEVDRLHARENEHVGIFNGVAEQAVPAIAELEQVKAELARLKEKLALKQDIINQLRAVQGRIRDAHNELKVIQGVLKANQVDLRTIIAAQDVELGKAKAELAEALTALREAIGGGWRSGHPGYAAKQSPWVEEERYNRWCRVLAGMPAAPSTPDVTQNAGEEDVRYCDGKGCIFDGERHWCDGGCGVPPRAQNAGEEAHLEPGYPSAADIASVAIASGGGFLSQEVDFQIVDNQGGECGFGGGNGTVCIKHVKVSPNGERYHGGGHMFATPEVAAQMRDPNRDAAVLIADMQAIPKTEVQSND